jgi:hypothetical protein
MENDFDIHNTYHSSDTITDFFDTIADSSDTVADSFDSFCLFLRRTHVSIHFIRSFFMQCFHGTKEFYLSC